MKLLAVIFLVGTVLSFANSEVRYLEKVLANEQERNARLKAKLKSARIENSGISNEIRDLENQITGQK